MWVKEEEVRQKNPLRPTACAPKRSPPPTFYSQVDGRPLTEIINEKHENVKYLAGINIGSNVSMSLVQGDPEAAR